MYTRKWLSTSSQFYLIPKTKQKAPPKVNKKETKLEQKIRKFGPTNQPPRKYDPKVGFFVKLKKKLSQAAIVIMRWEKKEKSNQIILGTTIISINKKKQTNPALTNKSILKKIYTSQYFTSPPRIAIFFHHKKNKSSSFILKTPAPPHPSLLLFLIPISTVFNFTKKITNPCLTPMEFFGYIQLQDPTY